MDQQKKLYVAIGVLLLLGGLLFVQRQGEHKEAAQHSLEGQAANLPKLEVTEESAKAIDRIVIHKPAGKEGAPAEDIELVKKGEEWRVSKPVDALANQANVKSLLDNLKALKPSEMIDSGTGSYDKFGVSDAKALHVTFMKGDAKLKYVGMTSFGQKRQVSVPLVVNEYKGGKFETLFVGQVD